MRGKFFLESLRAHFFTKKIGVWCLMLPLLNVCICKYIFAICKMFLFSMPHYKVFLEISFLRRSLYVTLTQNKTFVCLGISNTRRLDQRSPRFLFAQTFHTWPVPGSGGLL